MNVVTDKLLNFNIKYWDIKAAGPTILKNIYGIDITEESDKEQRNIKFGNLQRSDQKLKLIPNALLNYSKFLCKRNKGIIYTVDSVLTKNNINDDALVRSSFFLFKMNYHFHVLVISRKKNSYIAITKDDQVVIKGVDKKFLSEAIVRKLLTDGIDSLAKFKKWFKRAPAKDFMIDNKIIVANKIVEVKSDNYDIEPNREIYWLKLLPYIYAISVWKLELF